MNKQSSLAEGRIERVQLSNRVNKELLRAMKKIALEEEKDLYVVLEEAMQMMVEKRKQN